MIGSRETAVQIIEKLNEIHRLDPSVLGKLIDYRVRCNQALADHPTVQVGAAVYPPGYEVGFLGILNGLIGVKPDGWGYIAARNDESGKLVEFILLEDNNGDKRDAPPRKGAPLL